MLCPKCRSDNKSTNIRCVHCGNVLPSVHKEDMFDDRRNTRVEITTNFFILFWGGIACYMGWSIFSVFKLAYNGENGRYVAIFLFLLALVIFLCGVAMIVKGLYSLFSFCKSKLGMSVDKSKVRKVDEITGKVYGLTYKAQILIFAVMWVVMCGFSTYIVIESGQFHNLFPILPFWLFGFILFYKLFRK